MGKVGVRPIADVSITRYDVPMSQSRFQGMTLNERLFSAGVLQRFDEALRMQDRATLEELLILVEAEPNLANVLLGEGYQCWFCGEGIDRADGLALSIGLWELWGGAAEAEPAQMIYAHFKCAETRMKGASMDLDREIFLLEEPES
jgi:hypothetical protein